MKFQIYRFLSCILIGFLLVPLYAQNKVIKMDDGSQVSQYDKDNDGIVKARDRITLLPGFNYDAPPDASLQIDEDMICPVDYLTTEPDPDERDITANPVVGAIEGNFNVTKTGAATYSIPIEVPPGTNGMQPSISVNYNSQGGNGVLGKKWSLGGMSAISRVPTNLYHEDFIDGVDFDDNDKFALNGNRLILTSDKNYGDNGAVYHTEVENFSKVTSYGTAGSGPKKFKVQTKNGKTLYFGYTSDSRHKPSGATDVFTWYLTKVQDANGNYMKYVYKHDEHGHRLHKIKYTGNENTQPYNEVRFYYEERTFHHSTKYVGGGTIKQNLLLYNIKTFCENDMVKEYNFDYVKTQNASDYGYAHLVKVTPQLPTGEQLNATLMEWGDEETEFKQSGLLSLDQEVKSLQSGDFNGDGISDVIIIYNNKWHMYHGKSNSGFKKIGSGNLPADFKRCFCIDVNNDGKSDIVSICKVNKCKRKLDLMVSTGNSFQSHDLYPEIQFNSIDKLLPGDFNGDGKLDLLKIGYKNPGSTDECTFGDYENLWWIKTFIDGQFQNIQSGNSLFLNDNEFEDAVKIDDFNDDGKTDFMIIWDGDPNECKIYDWQLNEIYSNTGWPTKWHHIKTGDFNGDGKADILTWTENNGWKLHFFTGDESFIPWPAIDMPMTKSPENKKNKISVGDFNGDGKDDILEAYYFENTNSSTNYTTKFKVYYSNGYNNANDEYNYVMENNSWQWILGRFENKYSIKHNRFSDFNGDGKIDLLHTGWDKKGISLVEFHPNEQLHLVNQITNGFNNITKINYKPLTKSDLDDANSFYTLNNSNVDYPLKKLIGPLNVVTSTQYNNGVGGFNTVEYSYTEGLMHLKGKGFLGFDEFTEHNLATDQKTIKKYEVLKEGSNYYHQSLTRKKIKAGDELVTEINYVNDLAQFYNSRRGYTVTKRYFPYTEKIVKNNILKNRIITTINNYDNVNLVNDTKGNLILRKKQFGDKITQTTYYEDYTDKGSYMKYKPTTTRTVKEHADHESDFETKTTLSYDDNGNLKSKTKNAHSNDKSVTTYYENYDKLGNFETKRVEPEGMTGQTITYEHDDKGRFVTETTNDLGSITYTYDHTNGNILKINDLTGLTTTYRYDDWDKMHKIITRNNQVLTKETKWSNNQSTSYLYYELIEKDGSPYEKYYYDNHDRIVRKETEGYKGKTIYSEFNYNSKGEIIKRTNSLDDGEVVNNTSYSYSDIGRLKNIALPSGKTIEFDYSKNNEGYKIKQKIKFNGKTREYSKTYGPTDRLTHASDPGGSVSYKYHPCGKVKQITYPGGKDTMGYDECCNQISLYDPDLGSVNYKYNALGALTYKKDNKGNEFWYFYNNSGRLKKKAKNAAGTEILAEYNYIKSGNGKGSIKSMRNDNNITKTYKYTQYNRLKKVTENIQGHKFSREYSYDEAGNIIKVNHSDELTVRKKYSPRGFLTQVKANGTEVWRLNNHSAKKQEYTFGNGLTATNTFNKFGLPQSIKISDVHEWQYDFNKHNGNLLSREMHINGKSKTESFSYDNLNRLTKVTRNNNVLNMEYNKQGKHNMNTKSDIGDLKYTKKRNSGLHGVSKIKNITKRAQSLQNHNIQYTSFNKVSHIWNENKNKHMYFTYGPEFFRKKVDYYKNDILQYTRYYSKNCKKTLLDNGRKRKMYYINGGNGIAAAWVKQNGTSNLYYLHKDHLGSISAITDKNQNIVAHYGYDAWGNRLDPHTWDIIDSSQNTFTNRGFTGHEHIPEFNLINMNGRVYDPTIGQFLSPDQYVQFPNRTTSYNRYSYALNNPLKFTDPSGDYLFTTIFGTIGAVTSPLIYISTAVLYLNLHKATKEAWGKEEGWVNGLLETGHLMDEEIFGLDFEVVHREEDREEESTSQTIPSYSKVKYTPKSKLPTGVHYRERTKNVPNVNVDPAKAPKGCTFGVADMVSRWDPESKGYGYMEYHDAYYNEFPSHDPNTGGKGPYFPEINAMFYKDKWGSYFETQKNSGNTRPQIKQALNNNEVIVSQMNPRSGTGDDHNILIYGYREYDNGKFYLIYRDPQGGLPDKLYLDYEEYQKKIDYGQSVTGIKAP